MKQTALATDPRMMIPRRVDVASFDSPLEFFVVPTDYQGFVWLAKQKLLGKKLTAPIFDNATKRITGKML